MHKTGNAGFEKKDSAFPVSGHDSQSFAEILDGRAQIASNILNAAHSMRMEAENEVSKMGKSCL